MSRGNEEIGGEKKKNYPIQEMTWDNIIFPNFSIVTLPTLLFFFPLFEEKREDR